MVCNIIDECKCYAYKGEGNPMSNQFCAARRGPQLKPCPADCCAGGCPGQVKGITPRQPYRIVGRPVQRIEDNFNVMFIALVAVTILFLIYIT
jgi:hypothetical protein